MNSFLEYKKEHPGTKKTQDDPMFTDSSKEKPKVPPINPRKADKTEGFKALVDFAVNQGKVNTPHDASKLIRHLGYDEKEFADHLLDNLGKGVEFSHVKHFEDIGLIPKSYVQRAIKNKSLENSIPPKFHDEYGIQDRMASLIAGLEMKLGNVLEGMTKYKAKQLIYNIVEPHTKGFFSDDYWRPIKAITDALERSKIPFHLVKSEYTHETGKQMPKGKEWTYAIPVSDKGGFWLYIVASFGPSAIDTTTSSQEHKADKYDLVFQVEWNPEAKLA